MGSMHENETAERLVFVNTQMPESQANELTRIAKKSGRSRSSEIRMVLGTHIAAEQAAEASEAAEKSAA